MTSSRPDEILVNDYGNVVGFTRFVDSGGGWSAADMTIRRISHGWEIRCYTASRKTAKIHRGGSLLEVLRSAKESLRILRLLEAKNPTPMTAAFILGQPARTLKMVQVS